MATHFDAIGVTVSDMSRSVPFYRLLGLDFLDGAETEDHVAAALPGGTRLMLDTDEAVASFDPSHTPAVGAGRISLAFLCRDAVAVDKTYADVVQAGHHGARKPFDAFWGQRYATVLDPDGTSIDLFAPLDT